jgi:hypothetical protein
MQPEEVHRAQFVGQGWQELGFEEEYVELGQEVKH